jgi:hypothetical protein
MNTIKQGDWSRSAVDGSISDFLFNIAAGMHYAARIGDDQETSAYIEAYRTVMEFAWQRGYRAKNLESIAELPKKYMPGFYESDSPLAIKPIGQSTHAKKAMIEAMKETLRGFVHHATWAKEKKLQGQIEIAEVGYWHVMRIGWEFGWRPNDLDASERLPDELMPDFYRQWLAGGCN